MKYAIDALLCNLNSMSSTVYFLICHLGLNGSLYINIIIFGYADVVLFGLENLLDALVVI